MSIGVLPVRPRSISLSLAIHAAVLVAVLVLSAIGPEPLPTPVLAATTRGPIVWEVLSLRAAPRPAPIRRGIRRASPLAGIALAVPSAPMPSTSPVSPGPIQEVPNPVDASLGPTNGNCTEGCVVGAPDEGDPAGDGSRAEQVVPVVPGGVIRAPRKLRDLLPRYPELAVRSRLEGKVEIECRVDSSGRVVDARVVKGHPLLAPAAVEAVGQWAYQPTLLNGVPVSVIMTVTVHFRLRP